MDETEAHRVVSELDELVDARKTEIAENYVKVREAYQREYGLPEIDPLRHEIALCLVFGLYQAAITLTNHMLESVLKYGLMYHHAKKHQQPADQDVQGHAVQALVEWFSEGKKLYGDKDLDFTINRSCALGLISKAQKKKLHAVRESFRNAYSHADKDKTFGKTTTEVVPSYFDGQRMISDPAEVVHLADFPIGQGIFQAVLAKRFAIPYFLDIDCIARQVVRELFPPEPADESDGA